MGVPFVVLSYGKGSTAHSKHIVTGIISGRTRSFTSTTRKQVKDMFKKAVRKSLKNE